MRSKFAIGRTIGLLIAIIAIGGVAIPFSRSAIEYTSRFHDWQTARPMELSVDLSKPGEIATPFHQTCSCAHGEYIYLRLNPPRKPEEAAKDLLTGLSAVIVISDKDGNETKTVTVNAASADDAHYVEEIWLAEFWPFEKGEYTATVRVTSGAKGLTGRQHILYARYNLCGMELFPAYIAGLFAFGGGVIGIIAAACSLPGLLRDGFRKRIVEDDATAKG
jgi:hypothetical protein